MYIQLEDYSNSGWMCKICIGFRRSPRWVRSFYPFFCIFECSKFTLKWKKKLKCAVQFTNFKFWQVTALAHFCEQTTWKHVQRVFNALAINNKNCYLERYVQHQSLLLFSNSMLSRILHWISVEPKNTLNWSRIHSDPQLRRDVVLVDRRKINKSFLEI